MGKQDSNPDRDNGTRQTPASRSANSEREEHRRLAEFDRRVGPRYKGVKLKTYRCDCEGQRRLVAALYEYDEHMEERIAAGDGIVLFGPSGTGKDHLLIAMARRAICRYRRSVSWVNGLDLFGEMRDCIRADGDEGVIVRRYVAPQILILSDPVPPTGGLTEFQSAMLFRILDGRYRKCRPTWATLNVRSGVEADERMGAALVDRLRDGALTCHCDWPSHRKPRRLRDAAATSK